MPQGGMGQLRNEVAVGYRHRLCSFEAEGARTRYLENILRFMNEYRVSSPGHNCLQKLQELDLLEPMQAQFTLTSGQRLRRTGFSAANRENSNA